MRSTPFNLLLRLIVVTAIPTTVLLLPGAAGAASATDFSAAATVPTNNPRTFSFPNPPVGFDPVTANPTELLRYGIPPSPDARIFPKARQNWEAMVRHAKRSVIPHFTPQDGVKHNIDNEAWSGAVATLPPLKLCRPSPPPFGHPCPPSPPHQFFGVQGEWTVPSVNG